MKPKTRYRKRIEQEKADALDREVKMKWNIPNRKVKCEINEIYLNGKDPGLYLGRTIKTLGVYSDIDRNGNRVVVYKIRTGKKKEDVMEIRTSDFVYNSVKKRLDLYID